MNMLSHHDLLWCVRRLPRPVHDLLKANPNTLMVAGGYIRSCVCNDPVNDVDLFAPSKDQAKACSEILAKETGKKVHESPNAYTLRTRPFISQIIHRWTFDHPTKAIASFDFTIARAAFWWNGKVWCSCCDENFYPDLAARRLVYCAPERIEEAGGSMLRVLKFYQRGYRIPLDSLGAVIARLSSSVDMDKVRAKDADQEPTETRLARVLTGLLREVDPNIDPDHISHLPSASAPVEEGSNAEVQN